MHTPQLSDNLRRALLQAAIEGKLSERQADDGHAQDLLKQIQAEKAAQIQAGRPKKSKGLPEIGEDEKPFEIPENWVWVRLGDYLQFIDYRGMTPLKTKNGVRLITAANIKKGFFDYSTEAYISENEYQQRKARGVTELGDVIFTTEAPLGHCCLNPFEKASCGQRIITFKPYVTDGFVNQFIVYVINSAFFQKAINDNKSGVTAKGIKAATLKTLPIPLPPLAEQARIVAKLDALLAETDALKAQETALADAQKNFPKMLRASLLQAAIEGKLTERESGDGHAQDLLKQIQAEKTAQIQAGRLKKSKGLPEIGEDEKPFAIPENWVWVRLGEVILNNIGGGTPSKHNPSYWNGDIPWASVKDLNCDVLTKTIDTITAEGLENSSSNLIPKDTFVICTRMGLGKIALTEIDVAINQDLRAIFLSEFIDKKYFYHFYRSLKIEGKGATVKGITVEELHNILFPLPPLAEQARIVAKLDALLAQIESLENLS